MRCRGAGSVRDSAAAATIGAPRRLAPATAYCPISPFIREREIVILWISEVPS